MNSATTLMAPRHCRLQMKSATTGSDFLDTLTVYGAASAPHPCSWQPTSPCNFIDSLTMFTPLLSHTQSWLWSPKKMFIINVLKQYQDVVKRIQEAYPITQ
jgi:hypothetical protein